MSTLRDVMQELEGYGSEQTVKTFRRHGATGPMFGVKVADLKKIEKKIRGNQALALELWDTGNSDAMYLASLVADGSLMTLAQLDHWAKTAWWYMLSEYAVPFVAAENAKAFSVARKWMKSKQPSIQSSGWSTYGLAMSVRPDEQLDLAEIESLLSTVEEKVHSAENRVRYVMNGFVISVAGYVKPMLEHAKRTAKRIGAVEVNVGDTSCKVPLATEYISKLEKGNRAGKKRSSTRC